MKGVPDAAEMDMFDKLFTEIESYDGMKVEYLQFSKIGKGMAPSREHRLTAQS